MDADGSNQRRISFGGGGYATPVWSPRGDLIAFTRTGNFQIGVMGPDGSGERLDVERPVQFENLRHVVEGDAWR